MALAVASSTGLALVLMAIDLVCVYARRIFARSSLEPRLPRLIAGGLRTED